MFCLVSHSKTPSEGLGKVEQVFREQVIPLISSQPGFKGVCFMTRPSGEFVSLSIWDTEEQANSWPQNQEHQKLIIQLKDLLIGAPEREVFQVQAQVLNLPRN